MSILNKLTDWKSKTGKAFGTIMQVISRNSSYCDELRELTLFLDPIYGPAENISIQQRFYHVWFSHLELEYCPYCSAPREFSKMRKFSIDSYGVKPTNAVNYYATCDAVECKKRYNLEKTQEAVNTKYGVDNYFETAECKAKVIATNRERYGCDHQTQSQNFKDKTKITWTEKYGVEHHTQSASSKQKKVETVRTKYGVDQVLQNKIVMDKVQVTNRERYGGKSSMCSDVVKKKSKDTNQLKYGTAWYTQSEDFRKKFTATMIERYGVEHIMQHTPSFDANKSAQFKRKLYMFPSGRIEKIQGYEGFAINDLLNMGYAEADIVISNAEIEKQIGKIWYIDSIGIKRKYYPDIYVISENRVVEIKCDYTYTAGYTVNMHKKEATEALGIKFEFWIYKKDGTKIIK